MPASTPAITLAHRLQRSDRVLFQDVGGEAVLLDMASETYFSLNPAGTRIWALLDAGTLSEVHARLCREFDAPAETIERDLLTLADQLVRAGLATVDA